jgi:hypothetical protein
MVVIPLDPGDEAQLEFWRRRNPEALSVVEVMELKPGDAATAFICQVGGGRSPPRICRCGRFLSGRAGGGGPCATRGISCHGAPPLSPAFAPLPRRTSRVRRQPRTPRR